jgi:hypothetical protein
MQKEQIKEFFEGAKRLLKQFYIVLRLGRK